MYSYMGPPWTTRDAADSLSSHVIYKQSNEHHNDNYFESLTPKSEEICIVKRSLETYVTLYC